MGECLGDIAEKELKTQLEDMKIEMAEKEAQLTTALVDLRTKLQQAKKVKKGVLLVMVLLDCTKLAELD